MEKINFKKYVIEKELPFSLKESKVYLGGKEFEIKHNNKVMSVISGDDAIWVPLNKKIGIKIIHENKKYNTLRECHKNIKKFKILQDEDENFNLFPKIYDHLLKDNTLILLLENIDKSLNSNFSEINFIPDCDVNFVRSNIKNNLEDIKNCIFGLKKYGLLPEDEWYKKNNMRNGIILDFHRFKFDNTRSYFDCKKSKNELQETYNRYISRYKMMNLDNGKIKWKGKLYQGFEFKDTSFKGYTSDGKIFDSYRKLPFLPLNKIKGKKVLELGSNQGFFCFHSALQGAEKVIGIELTKEDHQTACDIQDLLEVKNICFKNEDAIKYVENSKESFELIIANSVIHQMFPHFNNSDKFMKKISKMCKYFAFETPVNHSLMMLPISEINSNLKKYFKVVRLLYVYDAYSGGYRANFICYSI